MNTYSIHESNMERLEKKMTALQNKCKKLNCDFHFAKVGEEFRTIKDENGNEVIARFILVEAEGKAILNGWEFVGEIEHTKQGNLIDSVANVEIPTRYFTSAPICEHCNSNRKRKHTFLIRNMDTNEFKQVGKSCLKDFLRGTDAELITGYISLFDSLIEGETPSCGFGKGQSYFPVADVLAYTVETIDHFGYVKSSPYEYCTKDRVQDYYLADNHPYLLTVKELERVSEEMREINFNAKTEKNYKRVEEVLAWIKSQERTNSYMSNLITICNLGNVALKNFGYLVSLLPTWDKNLEIEAKKRAAEQALIEEQEEATFVGEIKDKIQFKIDFFTILTSWDTEWGTTLMYKFKDILGNVYIWKTDKFITQEDLEKIKDCSLRGTIKEHSEFRGVKQNILTRCKLVEGC